MNIIKVLEKHMIWVLIIPLILGMVIGGSLPMLIMYDEGQQMNSNQDKYGLDVLDDEIKCWKICNKGDYYYSKSGLFGSNTCTCRITGKSVGEKE